MVSTIVILGWVLGILFNSLANISYLFVFWLKRKNLGIVPSWLLVMNILFLVLQMIFLLMLNVDNNTRG